MMCWKNYHLELLDDVRGISDLLYLTFDALENTLQPIVMVCGPMTTGNRSKKQNFKIFRKTIDKISRKYNVFDQAVLEDTVQRLMKEYSGSHGEKNERLLNEFYVPILKSGLIKKTNFIHGWEESQGASIEHNTAKKCRIKIEYLPENFLRR